MKVIVAGSRTITDVEFVKRTMNIAWKDMGSFSIISGTARGVDSVAEAIATHAGILVERFPADWDKYGKSAGYRRNEEMAKAADALLVIWDGTSKGTQHMIDIAEKAGLPVRVVIYKKEGTA